MAEGSRLGTILVTTTSLNTLFRLTLASGVISAVSLHLRRGAPVNGRDAKGRTPLILAAARGHADVCQLLLDAGADADLQDSDGRTALVAAQSRGHASVAALLLDIEIRHRCEQDFNCSSVGSVVLVPDDTAATPQNTPESNHVTCTLEHFQRPDAKLEWLQVSGATPDSIKGNPIAEADESNQGDGDDWMSDDVDLDNAQPSANAPVRERPLTGTASPSILPPAPHVTSLAPAIVSQEPSSDMLWEPEPQPVLTLIETGMQAAAAALQSGLTRHRVFVADTDWTNVDVDLPDMSSIWATGFTDNFDARRSTLDLLAAAMHEGWLPVEQLEELTAQAIDNHHETTAARALRIVLDGVGVLVEDEHALELSRTSVRAYADEPVSRKIEIDRAAQFLAELPADELDAETMLVEDAGRAGVLSASAEGSLFRKLRQSLTMILRLAAADPSTAEVLVRWAEQLTARHLTPKEVSTIGWGDGGAEMSVSPEIQADLPSDLVAGEDDADTSEEILDGEERQATQALASRLKEAAYRLRLGTDPASILGSLALTGRRVVELAENVLAVNEVTPRRAARRSRTYAREDLSELHLLRGRVEVGLLSSLEHEIGAALDAYIATRQAIVEGNLRRVVWNARRYSRSSVPFLDLVQEGQLGLLKAIDRFDAERNVRFGTYATWWIRQSIRRAVQDTGRTIRVPVHMLDRIATVRKKAEALKVRYNVESTPADVARYMEVDVRIVAQALAADHEVLPLDTIDDGAFDDGAFDDQDTVFPANSSIASQPIDLPTPLSTILHADLRARLLEALGRLDPRQARILDLRFGITTGEPMTLEEIGQIYGVTRERIRQIEAKALGRMPRFLPRHGFENMLP